MISDVLIPILSTVLRVSRATLSKMHHIDLVRSSLSDSKSSHFPTRRIAGVGCEGSRKVDKLRMRYEMNRINDLPQSTLVFASAAVCSAGIYSFHRRDVDGNVLPCFAYAGAMERTPGGLRRDRVHPLANVGGTILRR